jgi:hypothetical protein
MHKVYLKPGKEDSLKRFHPWIFSGAIAHFDGEPEEGEVVEVYTSKKEFIAKGHFQIGSIAVRVLSFKQEEINHDFWKHKLEVAYDMRRSIGIATNPTNNTYRLVHGEGDNLPGLVIDVYARTAVMQAHSAGMHVDRMAIAEALSEVMGDQIENIYYKSYHIILSKQDGSITRDIFIPFKTIDTPIVNDGDRFIANYSYQIRLSNGKCTLMDTSADTLYNYASDGTLSPFVVRTPSAHTMEPEVFLYMGIHTDRYYFMEAVKNVFNFEKGNGFYADELVYDKEEKAVFQVTIYNDDYVDKRTVAMTAKPINREIEDVTSLNAARLVEIYKKDQLKDGKLKEIASRLNEEDNPVIMLVKQKK